MRALRQYPAELRTTRPKGNDEELIHRAVVQHLRLRGDPRVIWYHVTNAPRSAASGARLKAMGMLAGVPDLAFILADGRPAFLELKSGKNKLSPEQTDFAKRCDAIGVECASAWGIDQALAVLIAWGVLPE